MSLRRSAKSVPFTPDKMPDIDSPGVLVIGAGSIGARHARNLRALGVKHITICDPDGARRTNIARELSCDESSTMDEGLKDDRIGIVFVCSPTKFHVPQAIAAAAQGKHLFIEKPLSHTQEGLADLERITRENGLVCMVGCNMRFHFGPRAVKRLLDQEKIGTPTHATVYTGSYLPDWRPNTDYRRSYSADPAQGGAILDCIHEIDLAQWYLGEAKLMECVRQQADALGIPVEGTADLKLHHTTGATSDVHLSFMEKTYKRFCVIEGDAGTLAWDFHKKTVEVTDSAGHIVETLSEPEGYDINAMYMEETRHFLQCVSFGKKPMGSLEEAIAVLSLTLAARSDSPHIP